jgi:hypothetical protein
MKGRHDALVRQNATLAQRLDALEAAAATYAAPAPPAPRQSSLITEKEVVDYGEEFLDVVGRKAVEKFSPEVEDLKAKVDKLTKSLESVGGHIAKDARGRMYDHLNEGCPNWAELNNNEKFLDWLALPDTYSGAIRHTLLDDAVAANNGPRALAFFKGFLSEAAVVDPQGTQPALPAAPAAAKIPLETLAAPGRARTAATSVPAEKPFFTQAQVTKFYADSAAGRYRGREDEKNTLDRQIFEAGREGRILK